MKRNIKYLTKKANNKCFNSNLSGRKAKAENKLLDYEEIISECTKDERNQHVKVSFMLAAEKQLYSKALIHAVEGQYFIVGVRVSQVRFSSTYSVQKCAKMCISSTHLSKKRAKTCKNVHLKYFGTQFKNVHLRGLCSLRPCVSRPYCIKTQKERISTKSINYLIRPSL